MQFALELETRRLTSPKSKPYQKITATKEANTLQKSAAKALGKYDKFFGI